MGSQYLAELLAVTKRQHFVGMPTDTATLESIQSSLHVRLPEDLKEFYNSLGEARLFERMNPPYHLIPAREIRRTRIDIFGADSDDWGPANWFTLCNVQDGNFIAFDAASVSGTYCWIIDCFHETFGQRGYHKIIAESFTDFLALALRSNGEHFWLKSGYVGFGDALERAKEKK